MKNIYLLDCTLRDGGYLNDWHFGKSHLLSIYERLVDSGTDIIEVGFLDERRPFDINKSIMPDTESVRKIWGSVKKRPFMIVGMIDYGTCGIENIQPCEESFLDGIRVIFKKHLMKEAMEYCRQIKALGYKVFAQLVSITSYSKEELLAVIELANKINPYAVSIVDTYGLLHPEELLDYYKVLDENLNEGIQIGFHAHNNFQLGYANALQFISQEGRHDIVVDGTLYGMGKSAGNAPIELIAMRLNEKYHKQYNIDAMLEAIEESILEFAKRMSWGYKLYYLLSGMNHCHPSYVGYLQQKDNLSVSKIDLLLASMEPNEKKLLYNKLIADEIYENYLRNDGNDEGVYENLKNELRSKKLLLIGPGKNVELQRKIVEKYIEKENPYIISINYLPPRYNVNAIFITNPKRYQQLNERLYLEGDKEIKILSTSNVESMYGDFDYVVNRAPLLEASEKIKDNSFLMLLKILERIGIDKVVCAGFDGYSEIEDNYLNPEMEYQFIKSETGYLNRHISEEVHELRKKMEIEFITYSQYDKYGGIDNAGF